MEEDSKPNHILMLQFFFLNCRFHTSDQDQADYIARLELIPSTGLSLMPWIRDHGERKSTGGKVPGSSKFLEGLQLIEERA
jgi:hypothetical protein